jgi:hypothetical protein
VNPDFVALLSELLAAEVRFMIVGAYALALHARPRATGDLDVWVEPTPENAARVLRALAAFGAPLSQVTLNDLVQTDTVFQIGVEPRRIDLLTSLSGLDFASAWPRRRMSRVEALDCPFLGREDLILNKRTVGRPRDLADLESLGE